MKTKQETESYMFGKYTHGIVVVALGVVLTSCYDKTQKADPTRTSKSPGIEYAPQMYHSKPYEPLSQVTDSTAGSNYFGGEIRPGVGEFYNSNPYNPHKMNMRLPAEGTIPFGNKPYTLAKDSLEAAAKLVSPFVLDMLVSQNDSTGAKTLSEKGKKQMEECKQLYLRFCSHCHGKDGKEAGKVGEKYGGVTPYNSPAVKDKPIGHIFHVITHGKGRMGAHGSQLSELERWKIATYVQTLQK